MTGDQQQKFCQKCTTHVHDLTDLNHEEIVALKVQNGGSLCGSFRLPAATRPIALGLGLGISSLALASCDKQNQAEVIKGEACPPEEEPIPVKPNHPEVMGIICPEPPKPIPQQQPQPDPKQPVLKGKIAAPQKNHVKLDPVRGEIVIQPKQVNPKIAQPKKPVMLLGDICEVPPQLQRKQPDKRLSD